MTCLAAAHLDESSTSVILLFHLCTVVTAVSPSCLLNKRTHVNYSVRTTNQVSHEKLKCSLDGQEL